jgi:hypothetical protein
MSEAMALCDEIQWAKPTDEATLRTLSMVLRTAGKSKVTASAIVVDSVHQLAKDLTGGQQTYRGLIKWNVASLSRRIHDQIV